MKPLPMEESMPIRRSSARIRKASMPSASSLGQADGPPSGFSDADMEINSDGISTLRSATPKFLKSVNIPRKRRFSTDALSNGLSLQTGSPTSSSSIRATDAEEPNSEYETPATSTTMTPREPLQSSKAKIITQTSRVNAADRARQLRDSNFSLGRQKGKRAWSELTDEEDEVDDTSITQDEILARKLQNEEYSGAGQSAYIEIEDSENDDDDEYGEEEDDDDEDDEDFQESDFPSAATIATKRRIKAHPSSGSQRKVPKRLSTLRSSNNRDIKRPRVAKDSEILDSEESALSEPDSDLLSLQESEFEDEETASEDDFKLARNLALRQANDDSELSNPSPARRRAAPSRRGRRPMTRAERERLKLETAHPEIITMWDDLSNTPRIPAALAKQPESINRPLKSFQLEGLNWMTKQEKTQWKGGLLGDEMGMGKTIQAVSLIMSDYPAKTPTLVVVPPVALMQWQNEVNEYTDGKLKILVYHNTNPKIKHLTRKELLKFDVIMISYSGLESIHRKEIKGWARGNGLVKEDSVIHSIHYHRLILDEAHNIKTRTTSVARACFALKGDYKWCLSGTPVQNRIGEFFSLLRFLEVKPFACYFCKSCSCKELHWSLTPDKKCTHCRHRGFDHVSVFNQEILGPITQGENQALRRQAFNKLRLITDRIMLRRVKRDHTASMELPPKEVVIHNEFFGDIERDFSTSIMTNSTRQFDTYVSRGVMLNNYANIFGLIMQMRQVANHPDLILRKHAEGGQNVLVCSICDEPAEEAIRSRCHHEFCRRCAKDYVRSFEGTVGAEPDCPRCHIPLSIDFDQPDIEQDEENIKKNSIINRIKMEDWTSSTKIEMLVYDLYKLRSKKQTHKSIVFSQFTSMLQLVEWRLRRAGFNTVMLDGSMSPTQRQRSIEYFMKNTDVEVFLVSLKAGGVALNLTEASRVFIVDPWWNPAAEWQSADRCHRIGQKRPCVITRLCIEDSVESRMVMLQEKKAAMINGTINNDDVALEKLTPEDMQFLFRGT
ncbi:hypothetical protein L228DRAFT_245623 [Xylona heveae TC161]|uniref:DNA repair protein RAD16 n=1 Tax=Xylona heveae (strain CBS 132557 / TC161) TaxID=1328760 RepID=A0A165IAT8_XYLHT|nr:hypothetical protein L228DRAFT_245623 [Xylona heveae TC161]KZF24640.1 hypothetical protein L228DRAFT_245623 [Xylona heveae TC161]